MTVSPPTLPAIVMLSSPAVPLTMTESAWPSPLPLPARRQVEFDLRDVGAGQVVDVMVSAPPRALKLDLLDAVEVHRDVADVAEEADAAAVGRDVDVLVGVGAVEEHRVGAGLAFDGVAAVARVPDEGVVAGAQEGHVVAAAAVDESLPSPPISMSAPSLPMIVSLPAPPSIVRLIDAGGQGRGIDACRRRRGR